MPLIPAGEWMPDQPPLGNPGSLIARNVYPALSTYRPVRDLQSQISGLTERQRGGFTHTNRDEDVFVISGGATRLNILESVSFTNVSKAGGYTTAADQRWEFTDFDTRVIASNFADPVQVLDLNDTVGTLFEDLFTSTLKPKARHIATVAANLMMGFTDDAVDGTQPDRLWWSAFRDPRNADPDSATQSNFIPLVGGGAIQRIVGGAEYGVIFQERQIRRATYVGGGSGSPIFDVIPIDRGRGTNIPGSVAARGRHVFYRSEDGFHYFDGSQSIPIGDERVDREFDRRFNDTAKASVYSTIDPFNKLYCILFPGLGSGELPNEIFFYHWPTNKWAETEQVAELLFESATQPVTVDTPLADFDNIDTGAFSNFPINSSRFRGGAIQVGAFDENHDFALFSGATKQATVDTTEQQFIPNRLSMVNKIRPLVEGGAPMVDTLYRDDLRDPPTREGFLGLETDGQVDVHRTARYHRFEIRMDAGDEDWDHIQGVQIEDDEIQDQGIQ